MQLYLSSLFIFKPSTARAGSTLFFYGIGWDDSNPGYRMMNRAIFQEVHLLNNEDITIGKK